MLQASVVAAAMALGGACAKPPPPIAEPVPEVAGLQRRPIPASGIHVVAAGETLSEIAWIYRLGVDGLARANDIHDPDSIVAGQRLRLRWSHPTEVAAVPPRRDDARPPVAPLRVRIVPPTGETPFDAVRLAAGATPGDAAGPTWAVPGGT